jgi:hypothetical protein
LSADSICGWQTDSGFPCFCLPPNCETGRHFLLFSCFVCRLKWWLADIFLFLLILSADTTWTWQTYLDFPRFVCRQTEPGRRFLDFINFVCRQMFEAGIFDFVMFAY